MMRNIMLPLNPRMMIISEIGRFSESILINKSSHAKPAIARIINKMPFKLSISIHSHLKLNFNWSRDSSSTYLMLGGTIALERLLLVYKCLLEGGNMRLNHLSDWSYNHPLGMLIIHREDQFLQRILYSHQDELD